MKKFIPLMAIVGLGLLSTGCAGDNAKKLSIDSNVKEFQTSVTNYSSLADKSLPTVLNKYRLSISDNTNSIADTERTQDMENNLKMQTTVVDESFNPNNNNIDNNDFDRQFTFDENQTTNLENQTTILKEEEQNNETLINTTDNTTTEENNTNSAVNIPEDNIDEEMNVQDTGNISTLYQLTEDIENYSQQYTELKSNLTKAIAETESLIAKVKNKEIQLSPEQSMMITNQSEQLKELAKELKNATSKLNLHLSDIDSLLTNEDFNKLSLKYLIILNDLANNNEMLTNGLATLSMINQMLYSNGNFAVPYGRVMYGFKTKGQEPKTGEFEIIDGKIVDTNNKQKDETNQENTNIDTNLNNTQSASNPNTRSNIDSYQSGYHNIDSFFNTAMLDNQFMFGNNALGMNGFYGGYSPYVYGNMNKANLQQPLNNSTDSTSSTSTKQNTQNKAENKPKHKKRFKHNIDTYNTNSNTNLIAKIKSFKTKLINKKPKAKNPVYTYTSNETVIENTNK